MSARAVERTAARIPASINQGPSTNPAMRSMATDTNSGILSDEISAPDATVLTSPSLRGRVSNVSLICGPADAPYDICITEIKTGINVQINTPIGYVRYPFSGRNLASAIISKSRNAKGKAIRYLDLVAEPIALLILDGVIPVNRLATYPW